MIKYWQHMGNMANRQNCINHIPIMTVIEKGADTPLQTTRHISLSRDTCLAHAASPVINDPSISFPNFSVRLRITLRTSSPNQNIRRLCLSHVSEVFSYRKLVTHHFLQKSEAVHSSCPRLRWTKSVRPNPLNDLMGQHLMNIHIEWLSKTMKH